MPTREEYPTYFFTTDFTQVFTTGFNHGFAYGLRAKATHRRTGTPLNEKHNFSLSSRAAVSYLPPAPPNLNVETGRADAAARNVRSC